ncbi:putative cyclin domain-containing protein [Helianthus debilis subsp. tardiflorus]
MYHSMARQANMNKENAPGSSIQKPISRITRARAKALGISGDTLPLQAKHESNRVLQPNCKRASSDNRPTDVGSSFQSKRRAVLKEVTNMPLNDLNIKIINGTKIQASKNTRIVVGWNTMVVPAVCVGPQDQKGKIKVTDDMTKQSVKELRQITAQLKLVNDLESKPSIYYNPKALRSSLPKGEIHIFNKVEAANAQVIVDIDSKHKDPQMCSLYAAEIYNNLRAAELKGRPLVNYMKTVQRDITQEMRGILIDWLVEVCEEYKLKSETLYLTVTLIDQYLSKMYIEKQRLQLLGITCMLIASKYEEIIAPRVEDFCFITDGTYTRREVLDMERQVVDVLSFQISVPTVIKFLRRFILAAQSSYKVPIVELEYLANYLAELTLTEHSFLKFPPSLIAASAVFLAKWTLDQVEHPWNPTLEHYTNYKASKLKETVLALQDIQLNKEATLHAIRQKYMQNKFNKVATLISQKPVKHLS